jgi:eukaryotic-like serine/threonine-protein kinase
MGANTLGTSLLGAKTLGGRYRPLRRIGSGGMGTVWEADDLVLHRRVAVKILSPSLCEDETVAARFHREAQAAGRLAHPNVAAVFDYGEEQGCPFIVMELVQGRTVRELLDERGRLPVDEALDVAAQVAEALAAAHAAGIVHRDVKPGNVMVADGGRVKVMDFGIADASWFDPITDTGIVMATARYISPEQATGGSGGPASDVYSLGMVLYEMLAGRAPFEGPSPFAVAAAHAYEVAPPVSRFVPSLPPSVAAIVDRATRKDARERPSAQALAFGLRTEGGGADDGATTPALAASTGDVAGDTAVLGPGAVPAPPPTSGSGWLWVAAAMLGLLLVVSVLVAATSGARGPGAATGSRTGVEARVGLSAEPLTGEGEAGSEAAREEEASADAGPGGGPGNGHGQGNGHAYGHDDGKGNDAD